MLESLLSVRLVEIMDLLVVWVLVWAGVSWMRATSARVGLAGLGVLVALYLIARQLGLTLTTWILQGFAAVAVLVGVVVFQQELRRLFEQIASLWFARRIVATGPDSVDVLTRTISNLVEHRRGALIVIPGREPIEGYVSGGIELDGRLSEPLLLSLFDPHSPGHDGAIIVSGDQVTRFAVHLPLSTDRAQLGQRGTRHAAGLGLAERTDVLSIIVSEEHGTVSLAERGQMRTLRESGEVADALSDFLSRLAPPSRERAPHFRTLLARWRDGAIALLIAALLWFLAVPGGTEVEVNRYVPIEVTGIPASHVLESVEPPKVRVTIAGRRRALFFLPEDQLQVRVDAILVELGRRTFSLSTADVVHPEGIEIRGIEPDEVKIQLRERSEPGSPSPAG